MAFVVLDKENIDEWQEHTRSLYEILGSYYEAYMNGLIKVEWNADGEITSVEESEY